MRTTLAEVDNLQGQKVSCGMNNGELPPVSQLEAGLNLRNNFVQVFIRDSRSLPEKC